METSAVRSSAIRQESHLETDGIGSMSIAEDIRNSGKLTPHRFWSRDRPHSKNAIENWTFAAAMVLAVFYFASSLYFASHRLFWFDEVLTVYVARLPNWTTIWTALAHATDTMSPVYDMIVRASDKLFGHSEVAARLPSALAMLGGLLLTFDCARRLTDGLHGLIALSLLTCTFLPYYGYEARSYAIYFMLAALALWVWIFAKDDKRFSAIFFGLVCFLGVSIHLYFVLCLVPYALWEFSRWKPWHPPSPQLIAGVLGMMVSIGLLLWVILPLARQFSAGFWAPPSLFALRSVFPQLFPDGLFLLALTIIWIVLAGGKNKNAVPEPMQPAEAVSWLFLTIPLAGFVLAELKTNAFYSRYFMGVLPGVAVAFSCWLWRFFHQKRRVAFGIFLLLAIWGVAKQVAVTRHPELVYTFPQEAHIRDYLKLAGLLRDDGKRYMVFSNPILYLEIQYYAKQECVLLLWPSVAEEADTARLERSLAQYYPLHFWTPEDLKKHAQETALIRPSQGMLDALREAGLRTQVRSARPLEVVYVQ